jgi:hypothetical protein
MPLSRFQQPASTSTRGTHRLLQGLAALLLVALPGAVLLCILHCVFPTRDGRDVHQGSQSFYCHSSQDEAASAPAPVSLSAFTTLLEGLPGPVGLMAFGPGLSALLIGAIFLTLSGRLADAPPAPPPRHLCAV